jgi:hypothetical protein
MSLGWPIIASNSDTPKKFATAATLLLTPLYGPMSPSVTLFDCHLITPHRNVI